MADAQPQCRLMNLPVDVHQMIVKSLDLPDILFPPAYRQERINGIPTGENNFDDQHAKYYGTDRNNKDHPGAYALLHWSSTCRFYRRHFEARILRHVVLRTHLKSIESIETLSRTPRWRHVKNLVVCNTLATLSQSARDAYTERSRDIEYEDDDVLSHWPEFPLTRLSALLSNLPPNLEALTLDFPWHWIDMVDSCMEFSATGDFGRMILVILRGICQNNLAAKASFTLRLVNLPKGSTECTPQGCHGLKSLLNCVTDCQISLAHWNNGAGWEQNRVMDMESFTRSLGPTFIQHLTNVETLELRANYSCPIGLAPGCGHLADFPQLSHGLRFHHLRKLTLDHFFIDDPLMAFVTLQSPNLEHLTLLSCGASGPNTSSEVADPPTWAEFFTRLNTGATNLRSLSLRHTYPNSGLLDMDTQGEKSDDIKLAHAALEHQASQQHITSARDWARRKQVLPHHILDDKYGILFDDQDENAARFLQGDDHRALLALWDAMESRGGEGVIYLPPSLTPPLDGSSEVSFCDTFLCLSLCTDIEPWSLT
ncbi:hypothetical protein AYO21_02055 [Fonsecaea monophora]|uniref:F-box domain-containing protein n=1 Tax=Fonsecaea monophora TaxID=254056 RepID=A0A177FHU9_9EURO|nr:hypothetical protein AYO21_02055 [Fonsecaea monophora]OAG43828.1 hypothetical protein AYO21_02055 [Fonsecaea monophora]